jgi:hypothetical protein
MTFDEDALLVRALGDVGGIAGARRDAEMGARRLKKIVLEIELALTCRRRPRPIASGRC